MRLLADAGYAPAPACTEHAPEAAKPSQKGEAYIEKSVDIAPLFQPGLSAACARIDCGVEHAKVHACGEAAAVTRIPISGFVDSPDIGVRDVPDASASAPLLFQPRVIFAL